MENKRTLNAMRAGIRDASAVASAITCVLWVVGLAISFIYTVMYFVIGAFLMLFAGMETAPSYFTMPLHDVVTIVVITCLCIPLPLSLICMFVLRLSAGKELAEERERETCHVD